MNWQAMLAWIVALQAPPTASLQRVEECYQAGEFARAQLEASRAWPHLSDDERADTVRILRKILFREGDASGTEALAREEVSRRLALACDTDACFARLCDAIESGLYVARARRGDTTAEAHWRDLYARQCEHRPDERSRALLLAGRSAMDEMRLPDAWRHLQEAVTVARARQNPIDEMNALGTLVTLGARLGRFDLVSQTTEAAWTAGLKILSAEDYVDEQERLLAAYLNNLGWSLLLLREAGYPTADPTKFLAPALAILDSLGTKQDVGEANNLRINLALAAVQQGNPATAWLRPVVERTLNEEELFWLKIVKARNEALRGRFDLAQADADEVERLARRADDAEMCVRASYLRGEIYERQGHLHEALRAYLDAERHLETLAVPAGLGQGRDHYIFELQRGSRRAIEILLRLGRIDRALCTLRLARGRAQRGLLADAEFRLWAGLLGRPQLEAELKACRTEVSSRLRAICLGEIERRRRDRRLSMVHSRPMEPTPTVSCEDLSPIEDGELLAAYVELPAGWWALVSDGARAAAVPLGKLEIGAQPERLAEHLLGPLEPWLTRADRVRILATEALHAVDFHRLPWRGKPLFMHVAVAYGLDLPRTSATMSRDSRAAVVAADPTATLRVFDEAYGVAAALEAGRLHPELLLGVGEAIGEELMPLLRNRLAHLYIGGHAGRLPTTAGLEPALDPEDLWDTVIRLEDDTVVSVEDLLTEVAPGTAPEIVTLLTCKSGLLDHATLSGGVGIAQAFLLRGSHAVIGTTQEVSDAIAYELGVAMYELWNPKDPFDAALLLAHSQAALARRGFPVDEVSKIRVWIR